MKMMPTISMCVLVVVMMMCADVDGQDRVGFRWLGLRDAVDSQEVEDVDNGRGFDVQDREPLLWKDGPVSLDEDADDEDADDRQALEDYVQFLLDLENAATDDDVNDDVTTPSGDVTTASSGDADSTA